MYVARRYCVLENLCDLAIVEIRANNFQDKQSRVIDECMHIGERMRLAADCTILFGTFLSILVLKWRVAALFLRMINCTKSACYVQLPCPFPGAPRKPFRGKGNLKLQLLCILIPLLFDHYPPEIYSP